MKSTWSESFGRRTGMVRWYPGGTGCFTIFATVPRSIPNRRAASRWLTPSRITMRRTRP